jgi:hypothetical protein
MENREITSRKVLLSKIPMPSAETFAPATSFNEEEADDLPF